MFNMNSFVYLHPCAKMNAAAMYTLVTLERNSTSVLHLIRWMNDESLLDITRDCSRCAVPMHIQRSAKFKLDGFALRCKRCHNTISVRSGSWFHRSHLPFKTLMSIVIHFDIMATVTQCSRYCGVNRSSVSCIYSNLRASIMRDLADSPIVFAENDIIEVDETLVSALRGEQTSEGLRSQGWVVGFVSRLSGYVHLYEVPNRLSETLIPLFVRVVPKGAIVITDAHRCYNDVHLYYTHHVLNKKKDGLSRSLDDQSLTVHTGTIEGVWSQLRAMLHISHGFPAHYVNAILCELMFRKAGRTVWKLIK